MIFHILVYTFPAKPNFVRSPSSFSSHRERFVEVIIGSFLLLVAVRSLPISFSFSLIPCIAIELEIVYFEFLDVI